MQKQRQKKSLAKGEIGRTIATGLSWTYAPDHGWFHGTLITSTETAYTLFRFAVSSILWNRVREQCRQKQVLRAAEATVYPATRAQLHRHRSRRLCPVITQVQPPPPPPVLTRIPHAPRPHPGTPTSRPHPGTPPTHPRSHPGTLPPHPRPTRLACSTSRTERLSRARRRFVVTPHPTPSRDPLCR